MILKGNKVLSSVFGLNHYLDLMYMLKGNCNSFFLLFLLLYIKYRDLYFILEVFLTLSLNFVLVWWPFFIHFC